MELRIPDNAVTTARIGTLSEEENRKVCALLEHEAAMWAAIEEFYRLHPVRHLLRRIGLLGGIDWKAREYAIDKVGVKSVTERFI